MNPELVAILDQAVRFSLIAFLVCFLAVLLFARSRLKRRKKRIGEIYAESAVPEDFVGESKHSPLNQWRITFHSFLISLATGIAVFVALVFLPLPFFTNFATSTAWQIQPLRVTSLSYDRFYEGFSLQGEVWNQGTEDIPSVSVTMTILGRDDELLDEVKSSVRPAPLPSGEAGAFQLEYRENSPFIQGYRLRFFDQEGHPIPHSTGFDAP